MELAAAYQSGEELTPEGLFELIADEAFGDGTLDPGEEALLARVARRYGIDATRSRRLAIRSRNRFVLASGGLRAAFDRHRLYARVLEYAVSDGRVEGRERQMLQELLSLLELSPEDHQRALAGLPSSVDGTLVRELQAMAVGMAPRRTRRTRPLEPVSGPAAPAPGRRTRPLRSVPGRVGDGGRDGGGPGGAEPVAGSRMDEDPLSAGVRRSRRTRVTRIRSMPPVAGPSPEVRLVRCLLGAGTLGLVLGVGATMSGALALVAIIALSLGLGFLAAAWWIVHQRD